MQWVMAAFSDLERCSHCSPLLHVVGALFLFLEPLLSGVLATRISNMRLADSPYSFDLYLSCMSHCCRPTKAQETLMFFLNRRNTRLTSMPMA